MGKQRAKRIKRRGILRWIVVVSFALVAFAFLPHNLLPRPGTDKETCANSISCINDLSGKFEEEQTTALFHRKTISIPETIVKRIDQLPVLGETTGKKQIRIDLSSQRLFAVEGDTVIYDFPVSTGKWFPTPTGTFNIWIKLRHTRMRGGSQALGTYYNLPNVPFTMFFYNRDYPKPRGFGVHGAYWHNNFGHPMSHGCVNMRIEDSEKLYRWAQPPTLNGVTYAKHDTPGTEIVIYGETPKE